MSLGQCVWGLDYSILLLPSGPLSDDQRVEEEAEDTDLHRFYRTGELLSHCVCVCVCVCVYSSDFLLIRVFPDAKRLKGRLSCQDVYYPGSWTSHRVRGISNSLLEDWCRWHFKLTERWSDRWVERRMSGEEVSDGFWDCVCFDYSLLSHGT